MSRTSALPLPLHDSPSAYVGFLGAPVAVIIWWLWRYLFPDGADQVPAIREEEPPRISTMLDAIPLEGVPGVRFLDPNSMEELIRGLPDDDAAAVQMSRQASSLQHDHIGRSDEVAGISSEVDDFRGILNGTATDISSSEEFAIHPANDVLRHALEILNGTATDKLNCWVSRVEEDAQVIFPDDMARRYIFLFNNVCYAWQIVRLPGGSFSNVELVSRLISMIQRYKKSYFDECWVPLIKSYLEGDSLKKPRRSYLYKFIAECLIICDRQMTWKVTAELRYDLRREMVDSIVPPCGVFLHALQANPSRFSEALYSLKRVLWGKKKPKEYTIEQLREAIEQLFESSDASYNS